MHVVDYISVCDVLLCQCGPVVSAATKQTDASALRHSNCCSTVVKSLNALRQAHLQSSVCVCVRVRAHNIAYLTICPKLIRNAALLLSQSLHMLCFYRTL